MIQKKKESSQYSQILYELAFGLYFRLITSVCYSLYINMSDDDFMLEDDDEDYNFDYEDDEQEEPDVDLENKYYNAKGIY